MTLLFPIFIIYNEVLEDFVYLNFFSFKRDISLRRKISLSIDVFKSLINFKKPYNLNLITMTESNFFNKNGPLIPYDPNFSRWCRMHYLFKKHPETHSIIYNIREGNDEFRPRLKDIFHRLVHEYPKFIRHFDENQQKYEDLYEQYERHGLI